MSPVTPLSVFSLFCSYRYSLHSSYSFLKNIYLFTYLLFIYLFIYLAAPDLLHCGGFSCCGAQALGVRASVVVAHGL